MLALQVILIAMLVDTPPVKAPALAPPAPAIQDPAVMAPNIDANDPRVAAIIKSDFESIAGPGSVAVDRTDGKLFNIRIAVPTLSSDFCNPIYDHELKLFRLFPDLNFDFYLRLRDSN
jgi:hypothetical protein